MHCALYRLLARPVLAVNFRIENVVQSVLNLLFVLVVLSPSGVAVANPDGACAKEFAILLKRAKSDVATLQFGETITVSGSKNKKPIETVFLGKTVGETGPEVLLYDPATKTRYHIDDRAVTWGKDPKAASPKTDHWYAHMPPNRDGTCAAHSHANCVIQLDSNLPALLDRGLSAQVQKEREEIYQRARDYLYVKNSSSSDFSEDLARADGFSARTVAASQKGFAEDVLQHLRDNKPVIMSYDSRREFSGDYVSRTPHGLSEIAESEYIAKHYPVPANGRESQSGHAILLLRVLEIPGRETMVLVQDSAGKGLRLVPWKELSHRDYSRPNLYLLVDKAAAAEKVDPNSKLIAELQRTDRPELAKVLTEKPKDFKTLTASQILDGTLPKGSWVVVERRAATLVNGQKKIVSGRLLKAGISDDGRSRYLVVDEGPSWNNEPTYVWDNAIESAHHYSPSQSKWEKTIQDAKLGDSIRLSHRKSIGGKSQTIEGTVVMVHTPDPKDPTFSKIDVLDKKSEKTVTLDSRELVSSAKNSAPASVADAKKALRKNLIDTLARVFGKSHVVAGHAIREGESSATVVFPRLGQSGFEVETMTGRPLIISLRDGYNIGGQTSFEAKLVSGESKELVVLVDGSRFTIPESQVDGILAYQSSETAQSSLETILTKSTRSQYMYSEKSDLPRARVALDGAIERKGADALPKFIKQAGLGDAVAIEFRERPSSQTRMVTGRVTSVEEGRLIVWSDASGESVWLESSSLVQSLYTKPLSLKWESLQVNAEKAQWRVLAEKAKSHYALVNLKTKNSTRITVYGELRIEDVGQTSRLSVTDSNGVVHEFDQNWITQMKVELTEKSAATKDLWAFPSEKPHRFPPR